MELKVVGAYLNVSRQIQCQITEFGRNKIKSTNLKNDIQKSLWHHNKIITWCKTCNFMWVKKCQHFHLLFICKDTEFIFHWQQICCHLICFLYRADEYRKIYVGCCSRMLKQPIFFDKINLFGPLEDICEMQPTILHVIIILFWKNAPIIVIIIKKRQDYVSWTNKISNRHRQCQDYSLSSARLSTNES